MAYRYAVFSFALLVGACVSTISVGGGSGDGTGSEGGSTSESESTASDSGGEPMLCPDNPGSCPFSECEGSSFCGGPISEFDADGCARPRCDVGTCPEGRTCVRLGDYLACGASSWSCELAEGTCGCGGTADCSPDVSVCVPDDVAPDPADAILTLEDFDQYCQAASTEEDCGTLSGFWDPAQGSEAWCSWARFVPTTLGENDTCEFGDVVTACRARIYGDEACPTVTDPGMCPADVSIVLDGSSTLLSDSACLFGADETCAFDPSGELVDGPPECACLCAANFDG